MKTGTKYALLLAGGYLVLGVSYIVVSGQMVSSVALTAEEAARLDVIKGVVYMVVTSVILGVSALTLFARADRKNQQLLKQQHAIMVNERRVTAGVMAASLSHDANNVLTALLGELESLRFPQPGEDATATLQRMQDALQRLAQLHQHLRNTGRQSFKESPRDVDLVTLVADAVGTLASHPTVKRCQLAHHHNGPLPMRVDPVLFHQALCNLVLNAAEATQGKGRVDIRVAGTSGDVTVEVDDNGPGIPVDRRADLFEALKTTKPEGSGLGLFSVRACVGVMGGTVTLTESQLGGACFRMVLPRTPPVPPAA